MGLLREYIRSLLIEAAKQAEDLPEGASIEIEHVGWGTAIYLNMPHSKRAGVVMITQDPKRNGPCSDAWEVIKAEAPSQGGWGPLLYDVAMEYTGQQGLMADRRQVSADAMNVWDFYLNSRSDVLPKQLDVDKNSKYKGFLTPHDESDDCRQDKYFTHHRINNPDWFDADKEDHVDDYLNSSITKAFVKQGTPTIDKLKAIGKLKETSRPI